MAKRTRLLKLRTVVPEPPPTYACKVTGHNLGNISYLVSKAAERGGFTFEFKARFADDGSLTWVEVPAAAETNHGVGYAQTVFAGAWLFLSPGGNGLTWGDYHPVTSGLFEEIA